jgi:formylglycine-generating enzyme required for sulfatase activity
LGAAGLLVAGLSLIGLYVHGRGHRSEPVVRLGPATTLPAGQLPQRIELEVGGGPAMRFALIPAGRFLMGSPPSEVGRVEDERQHEVIISRPFYMGVTAVTQGQYQAVMGNNPSEFTGEKNPVETVSWDDATVFCRRLSERSGCKVRLPTEAEWEYACRAGTSTPFYTGQVLPRDTANYYTGYFFPSNRAGKSRPKVLPVGSFRPNAWGLCDMHGSVLEWCNDRYGDYPSGPVRDPEGSDSGASRVLRGGSWYDIPRCCRSAYRICCAPVARIDHVGFRCVQDPPWSNPP